MKPVNSTPNEPQTQLKRVLGLWDLVFYGIILIQPIAAVGLFGIAQQLSHGQMVTTILIAMFAMMLTAISYGRMASIYPSAGSAYTYVSRGLNAHIGFLAGWAMVLDYLVVPVVSTIYAALALTRLVHGVPYAAWVVAIMLAVTILNIAGVRSAAKSNMILLAVMSIVIAWYFIMTIRYLMLHGGSPALLSMEPIYNPSSFNLRDIFTATSFVALTYIGFDGVTTLAEDVRNPRRNVLVATVLVCALTGVFSAIQIYLAARVWPTYNDFSNVETAFLDVCGRAGGQPLFEAMALTLFVACVGSTLTAQLGAARLLYGMGRDNVLPRKAFAKLDRRGTPVFNIVLIALVATAGSLLISYEHAAELLNFGAFIAFMGVNLSAIRSFYIGKKDGRLWRDALSPALGFLFCLFIWISLPWPAKVIGTIWLMTGTFYLAARTQGFRNPPAQLDFTE